MVGSFNEQDIVHGLREWGLSLESPADLIARERNLLHQDAALALNDAARNVVDALATRIRRERGWIE
jgi:hypothetical protein